MQRVRQKNCDDLVKKLVRDIYERKRGEVMAFDFEQLETFEGRGRFTYMMEELGLG